MYKMFCNICGEEIDGSGDFQMVDFKEIHLCLQHQKELQEWFIDKKSKYPLVKK